MSKKGLALFLAIVLAATFLAGCGPTGGADTGGTQGASQAGTTASQAGGSTAQAGGAVQDTLVYALPAPPAYLDPHIQAVNANYRVTTQIFDKLVMLDNDMNVQPRLAESWEVVDGQTTLFHLQPNAKFHNGDPVDAEAVKWSLERSKSQPGVNYNYLNISEISVVDELTVKIVTEEPFAYLLQRLALDAASIVSRRAIEENGEDHFNLNPVGAGPYKFVSWEIGGDIVLEAFEDYYSGAPAIKTIIIRTVPEAINRVIGLETGEIDVAIDLKAEDVASIEDNPDLKYLETLTQTTWYLGFNCQKPMFQDVRVRQAFAYALNIPEVIDIAFSGLAGNTEYSMLSERLFGWAPPQNVDYTTDLDKARELLAEAGYPDGMKATLWCWDSQVAKDLATVLQAQMRQVGVDLEIKSTESGMFTTETGKGEHDLLIMSKNSPDTDSHLRAMYHSDAYGMSGNRNFWSTPEVDAMIDEACATQDKDKALELYKEIQEAVAVELPLIPIGFEYLNAGARATLTDFNLCPTRTSYFFEASFSA